MRWSSADATHRGKVRSNNEDALISRPDAGLWAVADGMGGHHAGEVASQAIADSLAAVDTDRELWQQVDVVEDVLVAVNDALREHARTLRRGTTIGSTVVTMLARDAVGVALWAGDSRLYRARGDCVEQITRDHNPISDLLDDGVVSEAEALAADTNVVTRAVGGHSDLTLDLVVFDVEPSDTYLLCSDGLYRDTSSSDLLRALSADCVRDSVDQLLNHALAGPARDNVTMIVTRAQP